jgi:hypothetical protein
MQTYLKVIAGVMNVAMLVVAVALVMDSNQMTGEELLVAVLFIITPAFTLFTLFAPQQK